MISPLRATITIAKGYISTLLLCCLLLAVPTVSFAAEETSAPSKPSTLPNTPAEEKKATLSVTIPVSIERKGTDSLGAALSLELQDIFNKGSLCKLTLKEEPKILVLVSTEPEFSGRPAVGSAYSVVWLYYEGPRSFYSYMGNEVGIVTPETRSAVALKIAERTVQLATNYSYLFKN